MLENNFPVAATVLIAAAFFFAGGCDFAEPMDPTESRLRVVAEQYMRYCSDHAGQGPKSAPEFKQFLSDAGSSMLEKAGVGSADELFVSERDGEPLVVLYGGDTIWLDDLEIVVHETKGLHGQVMVGYRVGDTEMINADTLEEAKKRRR